MEWQDQGFVLAARRHGEGDAIVTALTREHGRHLGLVKGGASRKQRPWIEVGNRLALEWRARLSEQLGHFQIELLTAHAAACLDDPARLAALSSACSLVDVALPEREPHPDLFEDMEELIDALTRATADWPPDYVRWEARLLTGLGFGLDLASCALTGVTEDLAYVSPKTGRAVTSVAGQSYKDRLLPLPRFLIDPSIRADQTTLMEGLRLTGHFLERHVFDHAPKSAAETRSRLVSLLARAGR